LATSDTSSKRKGVPKHFRARPQRRKGRLTCQL
jgi:hypothetical protein